MLSEEIAGVEPREAARWWSDFRDGRADHSFLPGARRTITERAHDHTTMTEGVGRFAWEHVTAWPSEKEVRFVGHNLLSRFDGVYRFEPSGNGPTATRIVLEAHIHLARGLHWSESAAKPIVEAILRADLRGHAKDMRRDIGPH